jgi:hypothetical protein
LRGLPALSSTGAGEDDGWAAADIAKSHMKLRLPNKLMKEFISNKWILTKQIIRMSELIISLYV